MSIVKDKSFALAVRIVNINKYLAETHKEYVMSKQLLRSGTSVGANIRESQNAESDADFIHKLAIAQKECDETCYWLELLLATKYLSQSEFDSIYNDANEVLKIIKSIIISKKKNIFKSKIKTILSFFF
jgi:four helix bundle protein